MLQRFDRRAFLRRALYAGLLLLFFALQSTAGLFPAPFGVCAWLLIPAVVCIGMCERERSGLFFGLYAGLLWDSLLLGSNWHAIFLCLTGLVCGALTRRLMRNNIMTACLLGAVSVLLFALLRWLAECGLHWNAAALQMLLQFYLPCGLYSFLLTPLVYLPIRLIAQRFPSARAQGAGE